MFTAQGDMRQALNNVQSTFDGFGFVNADNVFKVRRGVCAEMTVCMYIMCMYVRRKASSPGHSQLFVQH